jgi:hypothetical protein
MWVLLKHRARRWVADTPYEVEGSEEYVGACSRLIVSQQWLWLNSIIPPLPSTSLFQRCTRVLPGTSDLRQFALMRNKVHKLALSAVRSRYGEARKWMISPVSRQSRYALDSLNFLVASVQIGLGTFVAFYLASLGWSKESVGLALASGQIAGVLG